MKKALIILILLVIAIPVGYLGLTYASVTYAKFSVSSISVKNPLEALTSTQLDIDLYLDVRGSGLFSVPVRSMQGQVYLEDTYMGAVTSEEPFTMRARWMKMLTLCPSLRMLLYVEKLIH